MIKISYGSVYIVLSLLIAVSSHSQTQAVKQLELDIQKLAQLKAMLSSMYKGYNILSSGYDNIKHQTLEGFNLHKHFIDGLSAISPAVKNATGIKTIIALQLQIVSEYKTTYNVVRTSGVFTPKELDQLSDAYNRIISRSAQHLDALQQVITAGKLQMSESERLLIIGSLAGDMEKQLGAVRTFTTQANQMAALRLKLKKENTSLRKSYGIER